MQTRAEKLNNLKETMNFLGALASGVEEAVGSPANSISYLAGKNLGEKLSAGCETTDDISKALKTLRRILAENSCLWHFEIFKPSTKSSLIEYTENGDEVMLVFRDCMIRQSLFMFGHAQKGSLCNMMFGFFAGAIKTIMGRSSSLEIIHAGENACYKRLIIEPGETKAVDQSDTGKRQGNERKSYN